MNTQDDVLDGELEEQAGAQEPRRPGTFTKGDPRINRNGSRGGSVPQLLRDLRHVYNQPRKKDRTQGQKMLRKLFEKNPEKFLYRLQKAEAEYRASHKQQLVPAPEVKEVDEGTQRSIAMLEDLLGKFQEQRAKEDAEFAKRPDAAAIGVTLQSRLDEALRREAVLREEVKRLRGRA